MGLPMLPGSKKLDPLGLIVAGSAALGAGFMGYLTYLHYAHEGVETVCDFAEGFSCEIVNKSVYSELFGIPVAVLGAAYFLTVLVLATRRYHPKPYPYILAFTIFSLVFGLYLSGIEYLVLHTVCLFCELSKLVMIDILVVSVLVMRRDKEKAPAGLLAAAVLAGALFAGGHYALTYEPPPQRDWSKAAQCLTEKGVSMYGSYTCPKCAKQKKLFGDAFQFIRYVECHPRGTNAATEACVERDVNKVPTWLQERNGEEVKRVVGVQQVETLAAEFGCPL